MNDMIRIAIAENIRRKLSKNRGGNFVKIGQLFATCSYFSSERPRPDAVSVEN